MNTYRYEDAFRDGVAQALEELGIDYTEGDLSAIYESYHSDAYEDDGLYDLDSFVDNYGYAEEGLYDLDSFVPDYEDYDPKLDYLAEESLKDYFNWKKERKIDTKNTRYYLKKYTSIARSLTKELKAKCKEALKNAQSQAEKIAIKRDFNNKIARVWEKCESLKSNIPNKLKEHDQAIKKTTY